MALDLTVQAIAGRLIVGLAGPQLSSVEEAWLRKWNPAGVILFSRNVFDDRQLYSLCARIHQVVPGIEIVADHEGGPVSQLAAAVGRPPSAWSLGQLDDVDLTRAVHRETGRRLRQVGIDRVLAPCADVLSERHNPVIGVRAFGDTAELVCRQVEAAVAGLRESGIAVCLKHWPGHGASSQDSHLVAADGHEDNSEGALWRHPFEAGLGAGAEAVMVGHLKQGGHDEPATLATALMDRWRGEFDAACKKPVRIYCDDITMGALRPAMAQLGCVPNDDLDTGLVDPAELPLAWLEALAAAGSDRLLIRGLPTLAFPVGGAAVSNNNPPDLIPGARSKFTYDPFPYDLAWQQWMHTLDQGFLDPKTSLGWVDFTATDRWEVAFEQNQNSRKKFEDHFARAFGKVVFVDHKAGLDPEMGYGRLLVTSHRPLPAGVLENGSIQESLPAQGSVLVAGHPSLATDLASWLPPGWVVTSCYDINWDKLLEIL